MTSSTRTSSASTWIGILLGVVLLAVVALFAILLPKTADESSEQPTQPESVDLTLPETLPGGYAAADDPAAFKGGQLAAQAQTIAAQQKANDAYGSKVLPDVLGTPAATRTYVADGTKAVFVQVFQSTGGAFSPNNLPQPSAGASPSTVMKAVGDGACILSYGQSASGQPATAPSFSQCQVSRDGLTVQIGAAGIEAGDLVDSADGLLGELQDQ